MTNKRLTLAAALLSISWWSGAVSYAADKATSKQRWPQGAQVCWTGSNATVSLPVEIVQGQIETVPYRAKMVIRGFVEDVKGDKVKLTISGIQYTLTEQPHWTAEDRMSGNLPSTILNGNRVSPGATTWGIVSEWRAC